MSISPFVCRVATLDDAAVITKMQIAMAVESENLVLDPEVVERGVKLPFQHPNLATYFVAVAREPTEKACPFINDRGEELAGMLMTTNEYYPDAAATLWWIQSVFTSQHQRKRGVFTQLYKHVENLAKASPNVMGLRLYVENENEGAQNTYSKMGMRVEPFRMLKNMKGAF